MGLPVIGQDCQQCPLKTKCWNSSKNPTPEVYVINLLVCRMKLGLKVEGSTRLFLKLIKPKLKTLARFIESKCYVADKAELYADLESACVEYVLTHYKLGERAWVLHYLFARPRGVMTGWALKYVARAHTAKRSRQVNLSDHPIRDADTTVSDLETQLQHANQAVTSSKVKSPPPLPAQDEDEPPSRTPVETVLRLVEDGLTLTAREYRVFRFMLTHNEDEGTHAWLAQHLGIDRSSGVSRVFRRAAQKLVEAVGATDEVTGIHADLDQNNRRQRVLGLEDKPLSPLEERGLVELSFAVGSALACQVYGVNDRVLYALRKKYDQEDHTSAADRPSHGVYGVLA